MSALRRAPISAASSPRRLITGVLALGTVAVLVSGCANFSNAAAPTELDARADPGAGGRAAAAAAR